MEKNNQNQKDEIIRKTSVLESLPQTRMNIKAMSKENIKKHLDIILNSYFLDMLIKEKIPKKEIINIAQKVIKAGYNNVNEMMLDDYYFDLVSLEFKNVLNSDFLMNNEKKSITVESSDEHKEGDMGDFINFM